MVGDLDPYESASGSYSVREMPPEDVPKSLFGRPYLRGQYQRSPNHLTQEYYLPAEDVPKSSNPRILSTVN